MKNLLLTWFTSLALCGVSLADVRNVGNGGDVVVCRDGQNKILSVELLDFYEGRVLNGRHPLPMDGDTDALVEIALQRLGKVNPTRQARYAKWAKSFHEEAAYIPNANLVDIDDSRHIVLPAGCTISQIAIQRPIREGIEKKRYVINDDLWKELNPLNQAGLILHELIYREAIEGDISDSKLVRLINSLIFSDTLSSVSFPSYAALLKDLHAPDIDVDLSVVNPGGVPHITGRFNAQLCIKKTDWDCESSFDLDGRLLFTIPKETSRQRRDFITISGLDYELYSGEVLHPEGTYLRFDRNSGSSVTVKGRKALVGKGPDGNRPVFFHVTDSKSDSSGPNFYVSFHLENDFWTSTRGVHGFVCRAGEILSLKNGEVSECTAVGAQTIETAEYSCSLFNEQRKVSNPAQLYFLDETGLLSFDRFLQDNEFAPLCRVRIPNLQLEESWVYSNYEDGRIRALIPHLDSTTSYGGVDLTYNNGMIFYPSRALKSVLTGVDLFYSVQKKNVRFLALDGRTNYSGHCRAVAFHENGALKEATLGDETELTNVQGVTQVYPPATRLRFAASGLVEQATDTCFLNDSQMEICRLFSFTMVCGH